MNADDYNEGELTAGRVKPGHLSELAAHFQRATGLAVDGMIGPGTRAALELLRGRVAGPVPTDPVAPADLSVDADGWLTGAGVTRMPMHPSWFYAKLDTASGNPGAIVWHFSSTEPGTAVSMFKRRLDKLNSTDRETSWHVSIETDGRIYQGASFLKGCWHAGGASAKGIPGLGRANRTAVGIELIGQGAAFPEAQVAAACRVARALVQRYGLSAARASVGHSDLDPTRKTDPGPVWRAQHQTRVITYSGAV